MSTWYERMMSVMYVQKNVSLVCRSSCNFAYFTCSGLSGEKWLATKWGSSGSRGPSSSRRSSSLPTASRLLSTKHVYKSSTRFVASLPSVSCVSCFDPDSECKEFKYINYIWSWIKLAVSKGLNIDLKNKIVKLPIVKTNITFVKDKGRK